MFTKWQWLFDKLRRTVSARVSVYVLMALFTALVAIPLQSITFPETISVAAESVDSILNILASSMLAVTTFSLSVMVSAFSAASATATPRATRLIQEDPTTHRVLGTFIGAFLFSLVGMIALSMDIYNDSGRIILFAVTIALVVIIVATILNWIEHLTSLGRVGETTDRVESAATRALKLRIQYPHLGGKYLDHENPPDYLSQTVMPVSTGYIQHIDMNCLQELAAEHEIEISVLKTPGSFVHPANAVAAYGGEASEALEKCIAAAFTIDTHRSFDQDPRFGLEVLTEIASRALSPAVNDPGTAIDVIGRSVRLLDIWKDHACLRDDDENIRFPGVRVPALRIQDLFDDVFLPIARDGAGMLEINVRLLKSLQSLKQLSGGTFDESVAHHVRVIVARAEKALITDEEKQVVRNLAESIAR